MLVIAVVLLSIVVARSSVDLEAIRAAARQGTLDALQSAGITAPRTPPISASTTLSLPLRAANRLGRADAPITIVEFADFQCPYCEKFSTDVEPQLIQQYVDTGQVAIVYKHAAILGDESMWAAEAAECAADQNQFWAYHDLLYARQSGENQGAFTKEKLIGFAQELKLDLTQFEPCLKNDLTLDRVQSDLQDSQAASVNATPTFFVNSQRIVGAQPLQVFVAAIAAN
jgi:protein-disulfide isomerase